MGGMWGAGCISESRTQQRVCGATMSDGGANWPVPDARELPQVINMVAKNHRDHCDYIDNTLDVVFGETSKIASALKATDEKLDSVSKGADSDGFKSLLGRCV